MSFNYEFKVGLTLFFLLLSSCSTPPELKSAETTHIQKAPMLTKIKSNYSISADLIQNQPIEFPDFILTLLNERDPEENSEVKSTSSVRIRSFLITYKDGASEKFEIYHGQLPPQAFKFKSKVGQFTINTFKSSKNEDLFPEKIEILKK